VAAIARDASVKRAHDLVFALEDLDEDAVLVEQNAGDVQVLVVGARVRASSA
jgi:hypothetical protein